MSSRLGGACGRGGRLCICCTSCRSPDGALWILCCVVATSIVATLSLRIDIVCCVVSGCSLCCAVVFVDICLSGGLAGGGGLGYAGGRAGGGGLASAGNSEGHRAESSPA